jgi:hypothetical protein
MRVTGSDWAIGRAAGSRRGSRLRPLCSQRRLACQANGAGSNDAGCAASWRGAAPRRAGCLNRVDRASGTKLRRHGRASSSMLIPGTGEAAAQHSCSRRRPLRVFRWAARGPCPLYLPRSGTTSATPGCSRAPHGLPGGRGLLRRCQHSSTRRSARRDGMIGAASDIPLAAALPVPAQRALACSLRQAAGCRFAETYVSGGTVARAVVTQPLRVARGDIIPTSADWSAPALQNSASRAAAC